MASTIIGGFTFQVEDTALADSEGAPIFEWIVSDPDGHSWEACDLLGASSGPEPSEERMLLALLRFVSADLERVRSGSSEAPMFPSAMLEAVAPISDEIGLACL